MCNKSFYRYKPKATACNTFAYDMISYSMTDWTTTKAELKEKLLKIIGNDFLAAGGKHQEVVSRLEKRLGKSETVIMKILSEK